MSKSILIVTGHLVTKKTLKFQKRIKNEYPNNFITFIHLFKNNQTMLELKKKVVDDTPSGFGKIIFFDCTEGAIKKIEDLYRTYRKGNKPQIIKLEKNPAEEVDENTTTDFKPNAVPALA